MKQMLVGMALLSAAVNVCAASKAAPSGKPPSQTAVHGNTAAKSATAAAMPFSLDTLDKGRIAPQYAGVSAKAVIDALEKATQLDKGEFESSAGFTQRRAAALATNLVGQLKVTDIFPFVVAVEKHTYGVPFYYTYDADSEQALLTVAPDQKTFNNIGGPNRDLRVDRPRYDNYQLQQDYAPKETYSASNAYGATVTVEKIDGTAYAFATYGSGGYSLKVPMDAKRAASELPSLKALLLVKVREPYVAYDFFYSKPTRDNPTDITKQTKSIVGDIMGVVFYSGKTGEILAKSPGLNSAKDTVADQQ